MKRVKVTVYHDEYNSNKVSAIKVWRTITGLGLKESKDFIESIFGGGHFRRVDVVLNMAQYGELAFVSDVDKSQAGLTFSNVERYEKPSITDFSDTTPN